MKLKIILCLTLVLSGVWAGCSNSGRRSAPTVVSTRLDSPAFVYLVGEFKHPGRITWTNGITLKDALAVGVLTEVARHRIRLRHEDGSQVQYKWSAVQPLANNPALKPGDWVISPEVLF
jgi:protein involved in polysaccharide export with SLBB domain